MVEPRFGHGTPAAFSRAAPMETRSDSTVSLPDAEIAKALLDEIAAGQRVVAHALNIRLRAWTGSPAGNGKRGTSVLN